MHVSPATKKQLAIEAKKLAGASVKDNLMRWHRSVNQMSGQFVLLVGKRIGEVSVEHLDEWIARVKAMDKEMERLRKKLAPKRKSKGR
jgi:hypothetical protein